MEKVGVGLRNTHMSWVSILYTSVKDAQVAGSILCAPYVRMCVLHLVQ